MATSTWQPKWWTKEKHESAWERVKDAMQRDWEQTKADFGAGGRELDQDVDDTLKQAAGKDVIPPPATPNAPGGTPQKRDWKDVEGAYRYGYGARQQYGAQHADWNDKLEGTLQSEWEELKDSGRVGWHDVKKWVRSGYDKARS
jgi:hypothetical protein